MALRGLTNRRLQRLIDLVRRGRLTALNPAYEIPQLRTLGHVCRHIWPFLRLRHLSADLRFFRLKHHQDEGLLVSGQMPLNPDRTRPYGSHGNRQTGD